MGTPFTSAQSGLWDASDVDTWGQGAGVYPQTAGDVVTVSAGHTVTYNVSSATEMGAMTINGLLSFKTNTNTKLTFGHVDVTVKNGGELRIGATGSVIGAAYLAELYWNTTADNSKGLVIEAGGKFTTAGDPTYYGSTIETVLQSDFTNGTQFTAIGNMSAKWKSGQVLLVHKNSLYSSYLTDTKRVTLNGAPSDAANSVCTTNETFSGTWKTGGKVINVSRNVIIGKLGAVTTIHNGSADYNTNRPRIADSNTATGNVNVADADLCGFSTIRSDYGPASANTWTRTVIHNGNVGLKAGANATIIDCVHFGLSIGMDGHASGTVSGNILACSSGYGYYNSPTAYGVFIQADIFGCSTGLSYSTSCVYSGKLYSCGGGILYCAACEFRGAKLYFNVTMTQSSVGLIFDSATSIGFDALGVERPNTTDITFWISDRAGSAYLRGTKIPSGGLVLSGRNSKQHFSEIYSEDHNQVVGAMTRYHSHATILKSTSTTRPGGAASSLDVTPLSNLGANAACVLKVFEWTLDAVPASPQANTIYILGTGWGATFPLATELYLEAEYISSATLPTKSLAVSTDVLVDNTNWKSFTVNYTPLQVGIVRLRLWFKRYVAGAKINVDNRLY